MDSESLNITAQRKHTTLPTVLIVASVLVTGWVAIAQTSAAFPTSFEVASIRPGDSNVRVRVEHRHQLVELRARAKNGLQAMALGYGLRRGGTGGAGKDSAKRRNGAAAPGPGSSD